MSPAEQVAALDAWLTAHPPPSCRPLTAAEMDAEDYWATVAENKQTEARAPMSRSDEQHRENNYEHHLDRLGGTR